MRARSLAALLAVTLTLLVVISLTLYTGIELRRFERAEARRGTFIYSAGQRLTPGVHTRMVDLAGTLGRLKYSEVQTSPAAPGQFRRSGGTWEIYVRGVEGTGGPREAQRLRLETRGERITRVYREGEDIGGASLEGEVLTSAGDRPGEEYRPVRFGEAPLTLVNAVLAAEDHRFFDHSGLDVRGLLRAAWANTRAGRVTQGGSTITQQLVKNRLLSAERTFFRKVNEAWLATIIEWRYPKEKILEAYLNEIYLGQRGALAIRGAGAAARAYFRKEIHQLTVSEAAVIAGMIRAPNGYSPALNPERARKRRDVVLQQMHDLGKLDARELERARQEPIHVQPASTPGQAAAYFTDYVRQELEANLDDDVPGGARVFTTLDIALQRFAEAAIGRGLDRLETRRPRLRRTEPTERLQGVIIALDAASGEVRALVGGRDYQVSQFNRAVVARRQPGSAFKPVVFLTALAPREGRPTFTAASLVDDSPITLPVAGGPWTPRNYEDRYEGRVTVRRALEHSLNSATVRIAQAVGLPAVVETARTLGLSGDLAPVPALALGAFEVTPVELARAYLPFANGGVRPAAPAVIRAVYSGEGSPLPLPTAEATKVISPSEAALMTSLLQGVVTSGTAASVRALGVNGEVAGKTGTTNDARDAWFVGYSSRLLALVWVGFDDGTPHGLSGAEAAVPIWADFMKQVLDAYPAPAFPASAGLTLANIDPTTGKLATRFCTTVVRETFIVGTEPPPCDEHGGAVDHAIDQMKDAWKRFREWLGR